eukprot:gene8557-33990_t
MADEIWKQTASGTWRLAGPLIDVRNPLRFSWAKHLSIRGSGTQIYKPSGTSPYALPLALVQMKRAPLYYSLNLTRGSTLGDETPTASITMKSNSVHLLQDPTPTPTLPAVKAPAPESGGVDPTAAGSDHIAHGQPRDGLPPKLPHAESVLAVPTTCLGLAGLHPWYRLMKQLWSNLEPWPNAEQQNKFVMYKLETMSMIMKLFCFLQFFGHMSVALKGGLCLLSLHALLLACLFSIPTIRALYKRDYLFAEKLLFAYSFMRKAFSFHIITNVPFAVNFTLFVRLGRAVAEPIRFQWALAENLSMMVLNCLFYFGVSFHWALLCHVLGLLTTVVLEMQHRKQFLALEKSL